MSRASARPLPVLLLRSRGLPAQVLYLAVSVAVAILAVPELDGVPLLDNRAVFRLVWLSCIPGVLATAFLAPPGPLEECLPGRPLGAIRAGWVLMLALLPPLFHALTQGLAPSPEPGWSWWFLRNHLLFLMLGVTVSAFLPGRSAWLPGSLYLLLCWFAGTRDAIATPRAWAVPNQPPDAAWTWVLSLSLLGCGLALQLRHPSRTDP